MNVLYITPRGEKVGYIGNDTANLKTYDMDHISKAISRGIIEKFDDISLTLLADLHDSNGSEISNDTLNEFDLILCDLTTANPNVLYQTGRAESFGKPILYFKSNDYSTPVCLMHKNVLFYSDVSIDDEFQKELFFQIEMAKENPSQFLSKSSKKESPPKAFISYCHQNKAYLERLMLHLRPLTKKGLIDIWVDTKIKTGDKWQEEIETALKNSSIAILLISADFMASDFIIDNELPPLLSKAEVKGTKILPVIISPCRFSREPTLNRFQAANPPSHPLSAMTDDEKETVYDKLAHDIEQAINDA